MGKTGISQDTVAKLFVKIELDTKVPSKLSRCFVPLILMCFLFFGKTTQAQSYIDDAKNLAKFSKLYKDKEALLNIYGSDILNQILIQKNAGALMPSSNREGGAMDFDENPIPEQRQAGGFNQLAMENLKKELEIYVSFLDFKGNYITGAGFNKTLDSVPDSFEYLVPTIQVLENSSAAGEGTSGIGLGSLLGVSQAEILQGITDWALNRAQEELMQAFLREWLEKIQADPILREAFPNTLTMLSTSDLASVFTDGDTWKATFQQDFDNIPNRIPQLATEIMNKLNVPETAKTELVSGLTAITTLFREIGKNKKADEILLLLGEESFVNNVNKNHKAIIDRSLVGLNIFLGSLQSKENGITKYTLASEILKLSEEELQMLWKIIFSRERDKLRFVFNLDEAGEIDFYKNGLKNLQKLKIQLTKIAESVHSFNDLLVKVNELEGKTFSAEQFNSYMLLIFDLLENGLSSMESLTHLNLDAANINTYRQKYIEGFKYVMSIHEGIKTKAYGKVALNTLNFAVWTKNHGIAENYDRLAAIDGINQLFNEGMRVGLAQDILDRAEAELNDNLTKFPNTKELALGKFKTLRTEISKDGFQFTNKNVKALIDDYLDFSEEDTRTILKEVAEKELLDLQTSSEALNKYTKLMASVILAENSDDIKEALDAVAMKTGGFLVKQHSAFSATVTFYPGLEYGRESLEGINGLPDTDGSYIGATLPIGVELTAGTNWNPIGAVGMFIQVLDLGAVLNYSLSNDSDTVASNPEFGFKQVFSPGAYLTLHLTNNPITIGAGASYSPALRKITDQAATIEANALQVGLFVAVDLNVFTLHGSRKKFALKSRSRKRTYED